MVKVYDRACKHEVCGALAAMLEKHEKERGCGFDLKWT